MVVANLHFGKCNINGGCKVLINGADDTSTRWLAYASGAYVGKDFISPSLERC